MNGYDICDISLLLSSFLTILATTTDRAVQMFRKRRRRMGAETRSSFTGCRVLHDPLYPYAGKQNGGILCCLSQSLELFRLRIWLVCKTLLNLVYLTVIVACVYTRYDIASHSAQKLGISNSSYSLMDQMEQTDQLGADLPNEEKYVLFYSVSVSFRCMNLL